MTITKRPRRPAAAKPVKTEGAEAFINAAPDAPAPVEPVAAVAVPPVPLDADKGDKKGDKKGVKKDKKHKKKAKKKEAVLIRFDNGQIKRIDEVAGALGLSRAAWVRMVVAQALPK